MKTGKPTMSGVKWGILRGSLYNIVVMNQGGAVCARMLPLALARSQRALGARPQQAVSALTQLLSPAAPDAAAPPPLPALIEDAPGLLNIRPLWLEEKDIIERAIDLCDGNINLAAVHLDISPSTIYRKKLSWKTQNAA